jgi:hypothetical protein
LGFELTANQLGLLFGWVRRFSASRSSRSASSRGNLRGLELFVDGHALVEQLFKFQAQLFQRRLALLPD